jgi:uncharacterized protein (TIGR03000 family)
MPRASDFERAVRTSSTDFNTLAQTLLRMVFQSSRVGSAAANGLGSRVVSSLVQEKDVRAMFRKMSSFGVMLTVVTALVLATPKTGQARGRGGHIGGSRHGYHNNAYSHRRVYYPLYGLDDEYLYDTDTYPSVGPGTTGYPNSRASAGITDPARFSTFTFTPPAGSFTAVYPPVAAGTGQTSHAAAITVKAPTNSQIWFDGTLMAAGGTVRQYFSPPLAPGHKYVYEIQARWNGNGHEVTQSKKVEVTAGAQVSVDFPVQSGNAG